MKNLRLLTLGVALAFGSAYAQTAQDQAEQSVTITQGPTITNITGNSATVKWTTDKVAANHVKYRPVTGGEWKSEFESQGTKNHELQITGLQPNTTYEYQILTRQKNVRTSGQFKTASTAAGTMPDVQGTGGSVSSSTASSTSSGGAPNANFTPNAPHGRVTLYRAVTASGSHVYVSSQSQMPAGSTQEGIAGYLIGRQAPNTVPLYAMSNPNGDFFYTTSSSERDAAKGMGYSDQGTIGYIASNQQRDTVPFYRLVLTNGSHFYTTNAQERADVIAKGGKDEGVVGYIWSR